MYYEFFRGYRRHLLSLLIPIIFRFYLFYELYMIYFSLQYFFTCERCSFSGRTNLGFVPKKHSDSSDDVTLYTFATYIQVQYWTPKITQLDIPILSKKKNVRVRIQMYISVLVQRMNSSNKIFEEFPPPRSLWLE